MPHDPQLRYCRDQKRLLRAANKTHKSMHLNRLSVVAGPVPIVRQWIVWLFFIGSDAAKTFDVLLRNVQSFDGRFLHFNIVRLQDRYVYALCHLRCQSPFAVGSDGREHAKYAARGIALKIFKIDLIQHRFIGFIRDPNSVFEMGIAVDKQRLRAANIVEVFDVDFEDGRCDDLSIR